MTHSHFKYGCQWTTSPSGEDIKIDTSMLPGSRHPRFFIITPESKIARFVGEPIPGVIRVLSSNPIGGGKWAGEEMVVRVAPGHFFVQFYVELHCTAFNTEERWTEVADFLGMYDFESLKSYALASWPEKWTARLSAPPADTF